MKFNDTDGKRETLEKGERGNQCVQWRECCGGVRQEWIADGKTQMSGMDLLERKNPEDYLLWLTIHLLASLLCPQQTLPRGCHNC